MLKEAVVESQAKREGKVEISLFPPESPAYKWWVTLTLMLGMTTTAMSVTVINIALPSIMTALRADLSTAQWMVTAPMIARTLMMPTVGWLGGMLGNRGLYMVSLGLFISSSTLCGTAWSSDSLIFFRIIQGLAGGPMMPIAMAILYQTFPPNLRGTAMGIWMFGFSFGQAIGPTLGGYLIEHLSWRSVFYINIPFGLLSLALCFFVMPKTESRAGFSVDFIGLLSMGTFVTTLLLALNEGRTEGWDSQYILTLFTVATVSFIIFLATELTVKNPVVDLMIFSNLPFTMSTTVRFFNGIAMMSMNFLITIFLQSVLHYTPLQAGILMFPAAIGMGASGLISGRLADKFDPRALIIMGLVMYSLVLYRFSTINPLTTTGFLLIIMAIRGFSTSFVGAPLSTLALSTLLEQKTRMGTGLMNLIQGLGGSFGVAMMGTILQRREAVHMTLYSQDPALLSDTTRGFVKNLTGIFQWNGDRPELARVKSTAFLRNMLATEARQNAYQECFAIVAALVLFSIIPVILVGKRKDIQKPERGAD
ncbi:MAG: DHA2 family efflux MFS transporter permease subunit [Candidatus Tectomicrobia bacterium]|nr:DHA2 family efflux MFS transporter permease subunit [Candidatus Tectomicrobia bacterium]